MSKKHSLKASQNLDCKESDRSFHQRWVFKLILQNIWWDKHKISSSCAPPPQLTTGRWIYSRNKWKLYNNLKVSVKFISLGFNKKILRVLLLGRQCKELCRLAPQENKHKWWKIFFKKSFKISGNCPKGTSKWRNVYLRKVTKSSSNNRNPRHWSHVLHSPSQAPCPLSLMESPPRQMWPRRQGSLYSQFQIKGYVFHQEVQVTSCSYPL